MGMECTIYMGAVDVERQRLNVFRMEMMGARVVAAQSGQKTLKEAVDEAIAAWVQEGDAAFYLLGSAVGPHPYPLMVRHFQAVVGREAREQIFTAEGKLPAACVACVGVIPCLGPRIGACSYPCTRSVHHCEPLWARG
jgi:tryptophan synthase beta chain